MKSKILIIAVALAGASSSFGALYTVTTGSTATSNGIASSGGLTNDPLAAAAVGTFTGYQSPSNPGIVAFGVFSSLTDAQITGTESLSTLVSAFNIFGTAGTFNTAGPSGQKGLFSRATSATVAGSIFSGKNIYILAGNGATFAASTELLVLKNSTLFSDAQDAVPTPATVTINTGNTSLLFGRLLADVRTTTADASVTAGWGTATAVPEPSAALLGAIGALGLLRRRRN